MLGGLFNKRSTDNGDAHRHQTGIASKSNLTKNLLISGHNSNSDPFSQQQSPLNYTTEDSYSRTILYGTPNQLTSVHLERNNFRLLIIEDTGELLQKENYKIICDSSNDHHHTSSQSCSNFQNRHSLSELLELMFGNQMYQNLNRYDSYKINILSSLPDLKQSILITKNFYVDNKKRYAIGIVIPISLNDFANTILSNWTSILKYLQIIKTCFIESHLLNKTNISQRSTQSNNQVLDVYTAFKQFIKSLIQLTTTPRLLVGLIKFDSVLYNWCFEVNNWIEIKDGAKLGYSGTKFLAALLTTVSQIKNQLVSAKESNNEFTRIIIMAMNPIVAQKLIFIISGLLPFKLNFEQQTPNLTRMNKIKPIKITQKTFEPSLNTNRRTPPTPSISNRTGWEIPNTPSRTMATPSVMTPSKNSVIQPTILSSSSSMAYLSSSLSHSYSQPSSFTSSLSRGLQLLQTWKNSSTISDTSSVSSSQSQPHAYNSPSPNLEYDEYPWYSSNTSTSITGNYNITPGLNHHLPRNNSYYDVSTSMKSSKVRQTIPELPHIDRNTSTLFKIGESQKTPVQLFNQTRKECFGLMNSKISTSVETDPFKNVNILNVSFDDDQKDEVINNQQQEDSKKGDFEHKHHTLPPLCGYSNEYAPEFRIQACPIVQDIEPKIINSMKNDLNVQSNSKTILVSLRAREIKEISLSKRLNPNTGITDYRSNYKKIYYNTKINPSIDKNEYNKTDKLLETIFDTFHETDGTNDLKAIEEMLQAL